MNIKQDTLPVTPLSQPIQTKTLPEYHRLPFQFTGTGKEYFGIWIVNLLLTIVTLGIYSAWAKVRNQRYFYGHTFLAGDNFEYTANPIGILVGRIIAGVLFVAITFSEFLSPSMTLVAFAITMAFFPWALRQSAKFNARNSWYRGVSFQFNGSIKGAYWVFLVLPILSVFTLFLLLPYVFYKQQEYVVGNHHFGTQRFRFLAEGKNYYHIALKLLGLSLLMGLIVAGFSAMSTVLVDASSAAMVTGFVSYLLFYIVITAVSTVLYTNMRYNSTRIAKHSFFANWQSKSYMKLLISNTLLTVFTLGLYLPFAKVRTAQYAAEHLQANVSDNLNEFLAAENAKTSAIGEGVSDFFDFDLGL